LRVPGDFIDQVVELFFVDEIVINIAVVLGGFIKLEGCFVLVDVVCENVIGVIK